MAEAPKPSLLLVEDSQVLAALIRKNLEATYAVHFAADGEEALRLIRKNPPFAAAVVDLILPRVDGFEVLRVLGRQDRKVPVVVITAKPRHAVEKDMAALGVEHLLIKPFEIEVLGKTLQNAVARMRLQEAGEVMLHPATGKKLPFRVARRHCYICGYEKVPVFQPIEGAASEDWSHGAYPVYASKGGYEAWDFLKTLVSICPYCFFASADTEDFAAGSESTYPYSEESKKILARAITVRKRLVPEAKDIDTRFDSPFRNRELVTHSLVLANKCCNGLVLAGKLGSYAQAGIYCTLLGALTHPHGENHYREAFTSFENQLKVRDMPRALLLKTYYFCIVLHMLLSRTAQGRAIMQTLESLYQDKRLEEIGEEERDWLVRINHTWKNGIDYVNPREIV